MRSSMLEKIKRIFNSLSDRLYAWALEKNKAMLEQAKDDHLLWLLLEDTIPGAKNIFGYRNVDGDRNGWQIFVRMELEPEYGQASTWIRMKKSRQNVVAKSMSSKDILDALMKAAQWDDITCVVPEKLRPMLNDKVEFEILKKGTVIEELKIKYELKVEI